MIVSTKSISERTEIVFFLEIQGAFGGREGFEARKGSFAEMLGSFEYIHGSICEREGFEARKSLLAEIFGSFAKI